MLCCEEPRKNLLLISSSTVYGRGYLDHVESEIRSMLAGLDRVLFVPFALYDRDAYAAKAKHRFRQMGFVLESVHEQLTQLPAKEAQAIFKASDTMPGISVDEYMALIREPIQPFEMNPKR